VNHDRHLVITAHGIHGADYNWGDIYRDWCDQHARAQHVSDIFWGRVNGLQMYAAKLIPFWMWARRDAAATEIRASLGAFAHQATTTLAGHSYGTQFIHDILWANPDLVVDNVILIASVLPERLDRTKWRQIHERGQVKRLLNVWSPNDSIIRAWSFWPYGKLGARGFTDANLPDWLWQFKTEEEHSTYFWTEFRAEFFRKITEWIIRTTDAEVAP
jgi:pimeloyl-ACP methyl ester carboxylesterase